MAVSGMTHKLHCPRLFNWYFVEVVDLYNSSTESLWKETHAVTVSELFVNWKEQLTYMPVYHTIQFLWNRYLHGARRPS
jgi:hypothetical protein